MDGCFSVHELLLLVCSLHVVSCLFLSSLPWLPWFVLPMYLNPATASYLCQIVFIAPVYKLSCFLCLKSSFLTTAPSWMKEFVLWTLHFCMRLPLLLGSSVFSFYSTIWPWWNEPWNRLSATLLSPNEYFFSKWTRTDDLQPGSCPPKEVWWHTWNVPVHF